MNQTKLTIKLLVPIAEKLERDLAKSFIKRDAFLNHLIDRELFHVTKALEGKRMSVQARSYVNVALDKKRSTKQLAIVMDKPVAERLRKVVARHGLSRDALINRILFFVLIGEIQLSRLNIPTSVSAVERSSDYLDRTPMGPMHTFSHTLDDPLFLIRTALEQVDETIYTIDLDKVAAGLNAKTACFLDDSEIPDSDLAELAKLLSVEDFERS